jgi:CHAT domain-containing protein/tetratricopeptide (TPR) repeat protein
VTSTSPSAALHSSVLGGLPLAAGSVVTLDDPLGAAIVDVLAGDLRRAATRCAAIAEGTDDPRLRARAASWGGAVASLRANTAPGDVGVGGIELVARATELWTSPSRPEVIPDEVALECEVVGTLLPHLRTARTLLGPTLVDVDRDGAVREVSERLDAIEARSSAVDDRTLVWWCHRSRADLLDRAGDTEGAAAALERAFAAAEGDRLATAATHLLVGDRALAPTTSPEAADHVLFDGGTETSALPWALERREADPAPRDLVRAADAYDAATALVGPGEPARLVLDLRTALLAAAHGDHGAAVRGCDEVTAAADGLGDRWSANAARLHGLLARVGAGAATGASPAPEEIGRWGADEGSFSYAFGLGLVLARAGRGWLVRLGDPDRALACHRLARRLFTALGAVTQVGQSIADEGAVLAAIGARSAATTRFEQAATDHLARTGHPTRGPDAWRRGATLAVRVHNLRLTEGDATALRRSAERLRAVGEQVPPGGEDVTDHALLHLVRELAAGAEVHAILAEGDAARERGDDQNAAARYEDALSVAVAAGDHLARAASAARLRRTEEAAAAYRDHEAAAAEDLASRVAELRELLGDGADALIAGSDPTGPVLRQAAAFHTRIGATADAGRAFDALDEVEPGWVEVEERPWELLSDHGHVREELGDLDRATELHERATETLLQRAGRVTRDELQVALNEGSGRVFGRAARAALRRAEEAGDPLGEAATRAFVLAEQGRARALAQLLSAGAGAVAPRSATDQQTGPGEAGMADPGAVGRWSAASAQVELFGQLLSAEYGVSRPDPERIVALQQRIAAAEAALATATDEVRTGAPHLFEALTPPAPVTVEEVAGFLPPGAVLVSYLAVDDDLLTFAVTSEGLAAARRQRVGAWRLHGDLRRFAAGCASGGPWAEAARAIAAVLLDPIAEVIEGASELTFVPTGAAHGAPLHALPWGEGLLVDHAPVALLPTAASLRHLRPPVVPPAAPVLVVGDPEDPVATGPGGVVSPAPMLPGAHLEAVVVAAHLGAGPPILGADATTAAVLERLGAARTVHVAAHATVDPVAPLASAILLAHGDTLRVADLVGPRLDADLVVLSACDTARGRVTGGDEVLGMVRALLAAGAGSAVVSLWPVDDRSTAVLLDRFAARLSSGVTPAAALREATRWFRSLDADGRSRAYVRLATGSVGDPGPPEEHGPGTLRSLVRSTVTTPPPAHPSQWAAFVYVGRHPGPVVTPAP